VAKWVPYTTTCQVPRTVVMRMPVDPCCGATSVVVGSPIVSGPPIVSGSSTVTGSTTTNKPTLADPEKMEEEPAEDDTDTVLKKDIEAEDPNAGTPLETVPEDALAPAAETEAEDEAEEFVVPAEEEETPTGETNGAAGDAPAGDRGVPEVEIELGEPA
jgi:hypothetical protein